MEYGVVTDHAQENTADANLYEHTENVYENTEHVYDPVTTQVPYEYKSDVAQTGISAPNHTRNICFSFNSIFVIRGLLEEFFLRFSLILQSMNSVNLWKK